MTAASTTVDAPRFGSSYQPASSVDEFTVDASSPRADYTQSAYVTGTTVDAPAPARSTYSQKVSIVEDTVDVPRSKTKKSKMGYYDEDGKHSLLPLL